MYKILIAGPSGSGKSTVAWALAQELNYAWFCLDGYFKNPVVVNYDGISYKSYEQPQCYDAKLLLENILTFEQNNAKIVEGLIVEGFCILQYPEILRLGNKRFFLDASQKLCLSRRYKRTQGKSPADETYKAIGHREALKYVYPQQAMADVVSIDSTLDTSTIIKEIKKHVFNSSAI